MCISLKEKEGKIRSVTKTGNMRMCTIRKKKGNVWRKIEKTKKVVQEEQPRQGSHRGGYKRDKLSRFFLPLQLPDGREYKQVFPGELFLVGPHGAHRKSTTIQTCLYVSKRNEQRPGAKTRIVRKNAGKRGWEKVESEKKKSTEAMSRSLPLNSAWKCFLGADTRGHCAARTRMHASSARNVNAISRYDNWTSMVMTRNR